MITSCPEGAKNFAITGHFERFLILYFTVLEKHRSLGAISNSAYER